MDPLHFQCFAVLKQEPSRNDAIRHADLQARGVPEELVLLAPLVDGLGDPHVEGTGRSPEDEALRFELLGLSTERPKALGARHVVLRVTLDVESKSLPARFAPNLGHLRRSPEKVDDSVLFCALWAPQKGSDLTPVFLGIKPKPLLALCLNIVVVGIDAALRHFEIKEAVANKKTKLQQKILSRPYQVSIL